MPEPIVKPLFAGQEKMTPSAIVLECARRMYPKCAWLVAGDNGTATDVASNLVDQNETIRFIDNLRELIMANGIEAKDAPKK